MSTTKTKSVEEVLAERGSEYGSFRDIAKLTQTLKSLTVTSTMNDVQREAMGMICHKMARLAVGDCNSRDGWLDIGGYANLVVIDLDSPRAESYNRGSDTGPWPGEESESTNRQRNFR